MQLELFSSAEMIYMKVYGDVSAESVHRWTAVSGKHYTNQAVVLMDLRELVSVSISVPDFTSRGLQEKQALKPVQNVKIAYVAGADLIYGFARVIETVWQDIVQVGVFKTMPEATEWLGIKDSSFDHLELLVREP